VLAKREVIMNTDLLRLYRQLDDIQSDEAKQLKNQIRETMSQNLRMHILELTSMGQVIGFNELQNELIKAIQLIEMQKR
jgi:bisphosphoglycerate-independent phosphoglycerate mutase (AlkP superfamily)